MVAQPTILPHNLHGALVRRVLGRFGTFLIMLVPPAYLGVCAVAADKFTHPLRQAIPPCTTYGLPYPCEEVQFLSTEDRVPLRGWFLDSPGTATILLLHGRDGRRDDPSFGMMGVARALLDHGYDVLTFDFRAHGESGGDRYSLGDFERRDITGALQYLQARGVRTIGAVAFSMGAGTLLRVVPTHPELQAVVADSPFAEVTPVIELHFTEVSGLPPVFLPGILGLTRLLYGIDTATNRPVDDMAHIGDRPVLIIHSADDEFIPVSHAYALQKAAASDPHFQLWITHGALHLRNYQQNPDEYTRRVLAFLDTYLR